MQQTPEETRPIRIRPVRIVRTTVIVGIVAVLAMLLAPLFNHSSGNGGSGVTDTSSVQTPSHPSTPPQTQPALPQVTQAVSVTIRQPPKPPPHAASSPRFISSSNPIRAKHLAAIWKKRLPPQTSNPAKLNPLRPTINPRPGCSPGTVALGSV